MLAAYRSPRAGRGVKLPALLRHYSLSPRPPGEVEHVAALASRWVASPHPPAHSRDLGSQGCQRALSGGAGAGGEEERVGAVVVGAGVVGLAVARALAVSGREVVIVDGEVAIGTGTSSRNSEVIHAGIYYPQGSLKARLCVRGKDLLYDFCESHGVPYKRLGKLIVATGVGQVAQLESILARAAANGVGDLQRLGAAETAALEPAVQCEGALLSPSTGIVDSHALMEALLGGAEAAGAALALRSRVVAGRALGGARGGLELTVRDDETGEETAVAANVVVNSAGLHAQAVAASIEGVPPASIPRRWLARGCYFALSGKSPFSRLVYPVPEPGTAGLGVHATLDLGGRCKFGPDVEWVDKVDYSLDPSRSRSFYEAIRGYYPGLKDGTLQPDYTGIRPKLSGPGEQAADFVVQGAGGAGGHGVRGLVNLYGIESPGLTASLAIAEHVERMLGGDP